MMSPGASALTRATVSKRASLTTLDHALEGPTEEGGAADFVGCVEPRRAVSHRPI
jgi:hypothetical protein